MIPNQLDVATRCLGHLGWWSIQRTSTIPHSCQPGVHEVLIFGLFTMIYAGDLRSILQVSHKRESVHATLAHVCLIAGHELSGFQNVVVTAAQHAARLDLWLCNIYIEPAACRWSDYTTGGRYLDLSSHGAGVTHGLNVTKSR